MMDARIVAVIACYNRRENTLQCLECYRSAALAADIQPAVVLLDDGSSDGTSKAVKELFPWVNILVGGGSLYWNGGMRVAFQAAINHGYDYYLWLNDDTNIVADALMRLLTIAEENDSCLTVGSLQDPITKALTYGGVRQVSKIRPLKFVAIEPDEGESIECDTFNGNCVLIPKNVVLKVGNLSADFTHGIGDYDYGLRAKKQGVKSIVAPGFYGECSRNPLPPCFDKRNAIVQRLKTLHSPKGVPPVEWMLFARRHAPYVWPLYLLKLYMRVIFP